MESFATLPANRRFIKDDSVSTTQIDSAAEGLFLHFQTALYQVPLPLGWMLSPMATHELDRQMPSATQTPECYADHMNNELAEIIVATLKGEAVGMKIPHPIDAHGECTRKDVG